MATEIDELKAKIARIERELQDAKRKLSEAQSSENGAKKKMPFAELRGIWKGADFTYEEIKSAEYKLDDEDHWE